METNGSKEEKKGRSGGAKKSGRDLRRMKTPQKRCPTDAARWRDAEGAESISELVKAKQRPESVPAAELGSNRRAQGNLDGFQKEPTSEQETQLRKKNKKQK